VIGLVLLLPLILGVGLFLAGAAAARWYANANPQQLAKRVRSGGSLALVVVGILLLVRGQVAIGGSLVMAGLGGLSGSQAGGHSFGGGLGGFGRAGRANARKRPGQTSTVRTRHLAATLDHDSGDMDVEVLTGQHQGRRLSEMTGTEVAALWRDLSADEESRLVLEAYLDRRHPEWRENAERDGDRGARGAGGPAGGGAMTVHEAYEVLGLQPGASEAEIRASHRRLMKQMHPDQGGSTYFAARLNEAKDILLKKR